MKTILETIVEHKKVEILKRKRLKPLNMLENSEFYQRDPLNPCASFSPDKPGIIAEFKRKSPSKGPISDAVDPLAVVSSYKKAGAVMASVLTDRDFFGGSFKDLSSVRKGIGDFPLLRKDFIIDPYQVHEAKAYGADVVLLIASILSKHEIMKLTQEAKSLGLSILLEVHTKEEIEKWNPSIAMVGVNNRDLKDFSVDIERSLELVSKLPTGTLKVSESGLKGEEEILKLFSAGYRGFLIGERFMKEEDPGIALSGLLKRIFEYHV